MVEFHQETLYYSGMKVELIPIEELSLDPSNVREHDERNGKAIVASLKRFKQQKPIVVDKDNVIRAGNGTYQAMCQLGYKEVACVRTRLEDAEAIAYAIADNRTAELANWDTGALAAILDQLEPDQLEATGFDESEISKLIGDMEDDIENSVDFNQEYLVLVTCSGEIQQNEVFSLCQKNDYEAKILS